MRNHWTGAALLSCALVVGCGDRQPETSQNLEPNAPPAAAENAAVGRNGPAVGAREQRAGSVPPKGRSSRSTGTSSRFSPPPDKGVARSAPRGQRPGPGGAPVARGHRPCGHGAAARTADGGLVGDGAGRNARPGPPAAGRRRGRLHRAAGRHRPARQRDRRRSRRTRPGTFAPRLPVHGSGTRRRTRGSAHQPRVVRGRSDQG